MRVLVLVWAAAAVLVGSAAAQEVSYSGSVQYTSGSYIFADPTWTWGFHTGLAVRWGVLRAGGSVPILVQSSGAVSMVGGVPVPTGGRDHEAVAGRRRGQPGAQGSDPMAVVVTDTGSAVVAAGATGAVVGDPLLTSGLVLHEGDRGFVRGVELTGAAKVPVTDLESGVGTGEWDVGLGAVAVLAVGRVLAYLDGAYWWYGDLPGLELRDGPSWAAGLSVPVGGRVWAMAMAARTSRILEGVDPGMSGSLGFAYRLSRAWSLSLLVGTGFSESSPDLMVSAGWRWGWGPGGR